MAPSNYWIKQNETLKLQLDVSFSGYIGDSDTAYRNNQNNAESDLKKDEPTYLSEKTLY